MAVKKAKLDNQFNASVRGMYKKDESMNTAEIFKGISVWINGYTGKIYYNLEVDFHFRFLYFIHILKLA